MTWLDVPLIKTPELVGLSKSELQEQLVNLKLEVSGEGDHVVSQSPDPGVKIKEGSTVRVQMSE